MRIKLDFMDKRIVYIGGGLIILSFIVLLASGYVNSSLTNNFQNYLIVNNFTVNSNSFTHVAINITNNSFIFSVIQLSSKANIYLFNQSGYDLWTLALGTANTQTTGLQDAIELEKSGALYIYQNTTNMTIPSGISSSITPPIYSINQTNVYTQ